MSTTEGKVIECRAAVAWKLKEPLSIETVQVDPPKAHEIRIKIVSTGVCHTDVNTLAGLGIEGHFPCILGHEGAGIVESIGEGVTDFKPGDHVIPLYIPQCNQCRFCKSKKTNLCKEYEDHLFGNSMPDGTSRFTCKGQKISHYMGCSTFSEYTVVPGRGLCKVNEKAAFSRACLLGCGVSTGYGAAVNTAKVEPGTTCAIWGLGGVGLACALGCKHNGASKIIGVDINPDKAETAKKFGVTDFINPKELNKPIHEVLAEMTCGGVDYAFECIGIPETMKAALDSAVWGWGTTIIIGVPAPGKMLEISPIHFIKGHRCIGSLFGDWKGKDNLPELVDKYVDNKINLDDFVTHELPFEKINESFDILYQGKCIRCILNY